MSTVHTCACGRSFTLAAWLELRFLGINSVTGHERVEWRNCPCGSTLTRAVEPADEVLVYSYAARCAKTATERAILMDRLHEAVGRLSGMWNVRTSGLSTEVARGTGTGPSVTEDLGLADAVWRSR